MITCNKCNKEFKNHRSLAGHMAWHVQRNDAEEFAKRKERGAIKLQKNESAYYQNPLKCVQCSVVIPYKKARFKKADSKKSLLLGRKGNIFCGKSCAASYNNTHKTHGNRKSKLEYYLEEKLPQIYPTIEFLFNKKDTINSELDIYIPLLKLAFELNGIFHYEPIYGKEKLAQIQNNDSRKFQACLEKGIELCIIDSSKLCYIKESTVKPYLDIVTSVIDQKVKSENLDLNSLPKVIYSDRNEEFLTKKMEHTKSFDRPSTKKECKCCKQKYESWSSYVPVYCSESCKIKFRRSKSLIYSAIENNKDNILKWVAEGKSLSYICKSLGYSSAGGNYGKAVNEFLKKEGVTKKLDNNS